MLKKLSKSRKKKISTKPTSSMAKQPKQPNKQTKEFKQTKQTSKHNHHASTLTLLSHHNASYASHASLLAESKSTAVKKGKSHKHRESSINSMYKQVKDGGVKQKQKSKSTKQTKKNKKNSSINPNSKSKKNIIKISPEKHDRSIKQNPPKKYNPHRQQQLYQRINIGQLKSKTNSEINFSNSNSIRQNCNASNLGQSRNRKILTIDCSDEYILNQYFSNSRIKNEKRRIEAAIKIQKIFRGYMTRKILKICGEGFENKYMRSSKKKKILSGRQGDKSQSGLENLSKIRSSRYFNQSQQDQRVSKKVSQDIFIDDNSVRDRSNSFSGHIYSEQHIEPIDLEISLKNSRKNALTPINHGELDEQSSIIYQQESLSRYLPFQQKYVTINVDEAQERDYEDNKIDEQSQLKEEKKQKSEEYFKLTPIVSSQQSKSKVEEPIPTDFSQKRIQQFQYDISIKSKEFQPVNYNKKGKSSIEYTQSSTQNFNFPFGGTNSIDFAKKSKQIDKIKVYDDSKKQKYFKNVSNNEGNNLLRKEKNLIKTLKQEQKEKWSKVIEMLSQQIKETKSKNEDNEKFMNMILEFSKKNKEELEKSTSFIEENSNKEMLKEERVYERQKEKDFVLFQKSKLQHSEQAVQNVEEPDLNLTTELIKAGKQKVSKNQDMPLIRKKIFNHNSNGSNKENLYYSLLEKTQQLKNFYRKNYSPYPIQEMIEIRQKALEKREKQMLNKLNEDLYNSILSHDQFIMRLSEMQEKFQTERKLINKAKTQIFVGYRATHKLMQDSFRDAWYLGYKIPFSQSLKDFKENYPANNLWVRQVIVDELRCFNSGSSLNMSGSIKIESKNKGTKNGQVNNSQSGILNNSSSILSITKNNKVIQQPSLLSEDEQSSFFKKDQQFPKNNSNLYGISPHEDSSLTLKQQSRNHQNSQHSVYSEEISYNEGEVEIHNLDSESKGGYIFDEQFSQQSSEQSLRKQQKIQGFKKVDPERFVRQHPFLNQHQIEGPLLLDPDEQEYIDNIVMRKISINQRRRPNYENFDGFQNLRRMEMTPRNSNTIVFNQPKIQVYKVDFGSQESEEDEFISKQNEQADPQIKQLTQIQITKLIWEITSQIYLNMHMKSKFCKNKNKAPLKISYQQQLAFVKQLEQQLPKFEQVLPRINQKMTVSKMELLKILRVNFDDEQEEDMNEDLEINFKDDEGRGSRRSGSSDGFEQIGKFQHILSADTCTNALNKYLQQADKMKSQRLLNLNEQKNEEMLANKIKQEFRQKLSPECIKKVTEREKSHIYNQIQKNDLRREIKKIQFHCIFDALNELLIKRRLKLNGYSGIGLNELTMIMCTESTQPVKQQKQYTGMIEQSIKQLYELLNPQKTSGEKLLLENYERLCENDSQWIYYTEEALSFALEFVYMLEDEIFFEQTVCIFKKMRKF